MAVFRYTSHEYPYASPQESLRGTLLCRPAKIHRRASRVSLDVIFFQHSKKQFICKRDNNEVRRKKGKERGNDGIGWQSTTISKHSLLERCAP
jgi:hypothetical protein